MPRLYKGTRALLVLAVLGVLLYVFIPRTDPAAEIRALLNELALQASFEDTQHPLHNLQTARSLAKHFTQDARGTFVREDEQREIVSERADIERYYLSARRYFAQLAFAAVDIDVTVAGDSAQAQLTGRAMGRTPDREDYFLERHRIALSLVFEDDRWLIAEGRNLP